MENGSLLQSFAIAKDGDLVSVAEVERGQACACACPVCKGSVIARQGDVRVWHFAHAHNSDCPGGAETALHLAAKKVIQRARGALYPAMVVNRSYRAPDGRQGYGEAALPEVWVDFEEVRTEVSFGDVVPDVIGCTAKATYLLEIGVTHFVDADKLARLRRLGLPAIEIDLSRFEREAWDWEALEQAVVHSTENKTWLLCPQQLWLEQQADELAQRDALAQPEVSASTPSPNSQPKRTRYLARGRLIDLRDYPFGVVVWTPYDRNLNEVIKGWARKYGGRYQPRFKNWLFPLAARPFIVGDIEQFSE
jgi:competence protein CoiA